MQSNKCNPLEEFGFKVDQEKNLFKKINDEFVLIQKLKKDIYKMSSYDDNYYFIDTFGDCFQIKETAVFLFGILSRPSYFNVLNNRIYTIDRYSRAWVHDLEGEILNIAFLKENVINVNIRADYCSVTTDGTPLVIDYTEKQENEGLKENKLMIFDRSFELIRSLNVEKILKYDDAYILLIINGKEKEISVKDHSARKSLKHEDI